MVIVYNWPVNENYSAAKDMVGCGSAFNKWNPSKAYVCLWAKCDINETGLFIVYCIRDRGVLLHDSPAWVAAVTSMGGARASILQLTLGPLHPDFYLFWSSAST
jgi:hypothetical protein